MDELGIEPNLVKVKSLCNMPYLVTPRDIQVLTGRIMPLVMVTKPMQAFLLSYLKQERRCVGVGAKGSFRTVEEVSHKLVHFKKTGLM